MSRYIRYEFEITFPDNPDNVTRIARLRQIRDNINSNEYLLDDINADSPLVLDVLSGESSDWARDDYARHKAVVGLVRGLYPEARVQTRWLDMEDLPWDSILDTEDEEDEGEDD